MPFGAFCLADIPLKNETGQENFLSNTASFMEKSTEMPGLHFFNLLESFDASADSISDDDDNENQGEKGLITKKQIANAKCSEADSSTATTQRHVQEECEYAAMTQSTRKDEATVQYLVFSLWQTEKHQQDNMFKDHSLESFEKNTPILAFYPKFSFWYQLNGRASQYLNSGLNEREALENCIPRYHVPGEKGTEIVVVCDWTVQSSVLMDTCLPFLTRLRELALSDNLKEQVLKTLESGNAKDCNDAETICHEYDLYLAHNLDNPNVFREFSMWESEKIYRIFCQLPAVQETIENIQRYLVVPHKPDISLWKIKKMKQA